MRAVWKYEVPVEDRFAVLMPEGATVLTVQLQVGQPCLWCLVDPHAAPVQREFVVRGTGHPFQETSQGRYVGTVQMGALVWHYFEATF